MQVQILLPVPNNKTINMIIHVQKPQPTAEQIMKVLLEQKRIEEKYSAFGRAERNENFRLLVINDLLAKIEKIR